MTHYKREQPGVFGLACHIASVHEDVLSAAVTVKVAEYLKITFFAELVAQLFRSEDRRMQNLAWAFPSPIKITPSQRTPVVSVDDTIGIEHGHYLEDEVLTQIFSLNGIGIHKKV